MTLYGRVYSTFSGLSIIRTAQLHNPITMPVAFKPTLCWQNKINVECLYEAGIETLTTLIFAVHFLIETQNLVLILSFFVWAIF